MVLTKRGAPTSSLVAFADSGSFSYAAYVNVNDSRAARRGGRTRSWTSRRSVS